MNKSNVTDCKPGDRYLLDELLFEYNDMDIWVSMSDFQNLLKRSCAENNKVRTESFPESLVKSIRR